jgi:hypothetical protein
MIMGSLKERNQDAQANGVRTSTLPDGDPSVARQSRRRAILSRFFVAMQDRKTLDLQQIAMARRAPNGAFPATTTAAARPLPSRPFRVQAAKSVEAESAFHASISCVT